MRPYVEELARLAPLSVTCYPNAGLPNEFGGYDETPERDGRASSREFARDGWLNLVGGCCGTTPEHIRAHRRGRARASRRAGPGGPGRQYTRSPASSRSSSAPTRTSS